MPSNHTRRVLLFAPSFYRWTLPLNLYSNLDAVQPLRMQRYVPGLTWLTLSCSRALPPPWDAPPSQPLSFAPSPLFNTQLLWRGDFKTAIFSWDISLALNPDGWRHRWLQELWPGVIQNAWSTHICLPTSISHKKILELYLAKHLISLQRRYFRCSFETKNKRIHQFVLGFLCICYG